MQEILNVLYIFGAIGIWATVFWLAKLIVSMKSGISAQADIINSFKNQSDYISTVQNTVSKLYDPSEIENLIKAKTEKIVEEERIKSKNLLIESLKEERKQAREVQEEFSKSYTKDLKYLYGYAARSVIYMNDSQIKELFSRLPEKDEKFEKFVFDMRTSILGIRKEEKNKFNNT